MSDRHAIRTKGPAEALAAITTIAGVTPTNTLVLVPFIDRTATGCIQFHLPDADPFAAAMRCTRVLMDVENITAVALAVFTDGDPADQEDFVCGLMAGIDLAGVRLLEAVYLTPTGWGQFFIGKHRPLDELPLLAPPSRQDDPGTALPPRDETLAARVAEALPTTLLEDEGPCAFIERVATADLDATDPALLATVTTIMASRVLRDVALVQWASNEHSGQAALLSRLSYLEATPLPVGTFRLADVLAGDAPRPKVHRLTAALTLCRTAAAHAPDELRAGLLAGCAWLSWALGHGPHAAEYVAAAREAGGPCLPFTEVLNYLIQTKAFPQWAVQP